MTATTTCGGVCGNYNTNNSNILASEQIRLHQHLVFSVSRLLGDRRTEVERGSSARQAAFVTAPLAAAVLAALASSASFRTAVGGLERLRADGVAARHERYLGAAVGVGQLDVGFCRACVQGEV